MTNQDPYVWIDPFEEIEKREKALEVAIQTVREVDHAKRSGARWYTKGESGLYQQIEMHVRRSFDAYATLKA